MASENRTVAHPKRPTILRPIAIRLGVVGAVVLLGGGLLATRGFAVRDDGESGPGSPAPLRPILEYHERMTADQRERVVSNRAQAGHLLIEGMKEFVAASRFAYLSCTRPQSFDGIVPTDRMQARWAFERCGQSLGWSGARLRDAYWHARKSDYHAHAAGYYAWLLASCVPRLPAPSIGLVEERRALEEEYLRIYGVRIVLAPEPPPQLLPGYVPPKLGEPAVPPFTMAPPDSF
jgi:hypothetical protein